MKYLFFTLVLNFSCIFLFGQNYDPAKISNDKCYGDCKKPIYYIDTVKNYYVYTGDSTEEKVKLKEIVLKDQPAKEIWVKKEIKNPFPDSSEEFAVMYRKTVPAVKESLITVLDTTQTRNFYVHTIPFKKKVVDQNWYKREVLCSKKLNKEVIKKIQKALKDLDYFDHKINGKMDNRLLEAMEDFQKENELYIGGITMEALDLLKIEIE